MIVGASAFVSSGREGWRGCPHGRWGCRRSAWTPPAPAAPGSAARRPGADLHIDAASAAAFFNPVATCAKWGAGPVMVAVQTKGADTGLGGMPRSERTLVASQGYRTGITRGRGEGRAGLRRPGVSGHA
ncbi:hypothetical protein ACIRU3_39825 [Streptomyces sp. NPDC101151]|uniref:hypothetical protein n=1 Tax=Streptomyces sp. NPDC101151 TaxID=3366115 RepID=UPI0038190541